VDEPRSGHRLDHRADRLSVDLVETAGEPLQRVDVGRDGELVKVLSLTGEQANIELLATEVESSVQHVERVLLGARFSVNTSSVSPKGDPSSWQSGAAISPRRSLCGNCPTTAVSMKVPLSITGTST
jgi:hypothetical protein